MRESSDEEEKGVLATAKHTALAPFRAAVSKPARRAYISTFLLASTSFILAGIAITAYVLFYFAYIPTRGFTRPIHLQFSPDHHPYGNASLSNQLVSSQPYDVRVLLYMPRTPTNREAGNFMLDLRLENEAEVLAHERRPTILTYRSPVVEYMHKAVDMPWYMVGWKHEAETLDIIMMEGVEFTRGWRNVPRSATLELQSLEGKLQVYDVRLVFTARFRGLRYVMYNHRIVSFLVFTTTFWAFEMTFAFAAWLVLSFLIFPSSRTEPKREPADEDSAAVKVERDTEEEDLANLSDTSRTFPTYSRQPPLRYSSPPVKEEEEEAEEAVPIQAPPLEADDEDEDADFVLDNDERFRDSGLGTSMDSAADRGGAARRRSRLFEGGSRNR